MESQLLGQHTYAEIMSQGDVWKKTLEHAPAQLEAARTWFSQPHGEVLFTGCGSTYYLSIAAAKHWVDITRESARGVPGSEIWYYPTSTFSTTAPLLVAISRSGETTETLRAIREYKTRFGKDCLVISCYPEATMVHETEYALLSPHAKESSIAQTRSFSSMFILSQILAGYVAGDKAYLAELECLPDKFDTLVGENDSLVEMIAHDQHLNHFVFLGSGLYYGLANEVMLKQKEMSTSISEAFHFMEFRHGPMSMITDQSLVIGLMSDTRRREENKVLQDMKQLGATTFALTEDSNEVDADYIIELKSGLSEKARGALYLPLLQLMGLYHSLSKGLNPDQPTNLQAVVHL
jgi:glucosamine--fructose-6-phosphate aminotransferase (isomerizing)